MKKNVSFVSFCLLLASALSAQPEFLDNSFGTNGLVLTQIQTLDVIETTAVLQPDGKVIAAGVIYDSGFVDNFPLARYTTGGSLDTEFGNNGIVIKETYLFVGKISAPVLQPDGKIIIGGENAPLEGTQGGLLFRFLPDGVIDTSFFAFAPWEINAIALQPDGKILTVGIAVTDFGPFSSKLARYHPDGSRDVDFGHFGVVSIPKRWKFLALQADGKILIVGTYADSGLFRYLPDGSIDESFGIDGIQTADFGFDNMFPASVALQPDRKILLAAHDYSRFAIARYHDDGSLDESFGTEGKVVMEIANSSFQLRTLALAPDGKILAAGRLNDDFFLACFQPDGTLDESVGIDGFLTTDFNGGDDRANSILIQPDGKIILAGESDGKFALARYKPGLAVGATDVFKPSVGRLEISPNPANDLLNIRFPEPISGPLEVRIFSENGRLISRQWIEAGQPIKAGSLPNGMYTASTMLNGHHYSGKFIKSE